LRLIFSSLKTVKRDHLKNLTLMFSIQLVSIG